MKMVADAYVRVRANKGSSGVDAVTIAMFEKDVTKQLYKVWNRMTSGSYQPPEVRLVQIPKSNGKLRDLGIPTVGDRVAQEVIKHYLEPRYESLFSTSSYGYRPNRNAHEAIGKCQQNCWKYSWVIDLDIAAFFDNINHDWLMRMLDLEVSEKWVKMYIKRWLTAPLKTSSGEIKVRDKGTPQGGVISPLLANIYLHYVLDMWLDKKYKRNPFERYADDMIIHCSTKAEAEEMLKEIRERLAKFGLQLNETKTRIVYCKQNYRPKEEKGQELTFTFLGYDFNPRTSKNKSSGRKFVSYMAAIGKTAKKKIVETLKKMEIHRRTEITIEEMAAKVNPKVAGWINYYGKFNKHELWNTLNQLNRRIIKWWKKKYKITSIYKAVEQLKALEKQSPKLFAHWSAGFLI
jgi:group II intron reverse transcriptase/maturase